MESDLTRQLSSSLFQVVKPYCSQVSDIASQASIGDFDTLTHALRQVSITLTSHLQSHRKQEKNVGFGGYVLSTKLADYVFFPLSNLLKQPSLPELVVQYILEIMGFLIAHAWSHDIDAKMLDQLFALSIFLSGGEQIQKKRLSCVSGKSASFISAVSSCLVSLVKCAPRDYYTDKENLEKRLSLLGDSTTILLDVLDTLDSKKDDEIVPILQSLAWLYSTRATPDQASFVFPGIVSKVINYQSKTKNLSSGSLLAILNLLKALIVKVFSDKSLDITICDDTAPDFSTLSALLHEEGSKKLDEIPVRVILANSEKSPRSNAWLEATSKQLKISLLVFFKNLILSSSSRTKITHNQKLSDGIVGFISEIVRTCFRALFREVIPATFDILSALFYVVSDNQPEIVARHLFGKIESIYLMLGRSDLSLLYKQISAKTGNLISTQLPQILLSASEEKIGLCISALKVHLYVISVVSETLLFGTELLHELSTTALETLAENISKNVGRVHAGAKSGVGKKELLQLLGGQTPEESSKNTLDEIELPPHIDAKKLGTISKKEESLVPSNQTNLLKHVDLDIHSGDRAQQLFGNAYSKHSEELIQDFALFLGEFCSAGSESTISYLVEPSDTSGDEIGSLTHRAVSLWLANSLYKTNKKTDSHNDFNIDEFLEFDEGSEDDASISSPDEEASYLLLQTAQNMLDDTKALLEQGNFDPRSNEYRICENSYAVALESMGLLATKLSKEDFQADVLMDYLYPLLEALTYTPQSQVHIQAKLSLAQIVDRHYGGSLENLVKDNADYLIDSLSMNLSVSSGLTPSLPGILLVVIKISGVQLLLSNQLQDILSEIFIVIDSFHGYSTLVENFFNVFEEIVRKVKELYGRHLSDLTKVSGSEESPYKPWGLTDMSQVLRLIDDAHKLVDPFSNYEPGKEYFRKPGVPFSEQADSDDEDMDDQEEAPEIEPPEVWPSPVPKNIYISVQQLFTYGLQLLSHPSVKLRIQILSTLREAYTIMGSNYKVLMPLLAQYWPLLLVMSTGSETMSDDISESRLSPNDQLIAPTLELMLVIFDEDQRHERFMSSRFVDMWEFWKMKAPVVSGIVRSDGPPEGKKAVVKARSPKGVGALYSKLLIRGINAYPRSVPDLVAHEMIRVCQSLGIDESEEINRDVQGHLWVLKNVAKAEGVRQGGSTGD